MPVTNEEVYKIHRDYLEHEDELVHHRTTALITIQSFLIATFGFTYQKKYEIAEKLFSQDKSLTPAALGSITDEYNGFLFILAIVGAIFIIGKLQESSSDIEGAVSDQMKLKIVSSSPGIIFGVLGTVLMLSTILQHAEISVKDQPLFLNPANVYVNSANTMMVDSVAKPNAHQIDPKDLEGLEEDNAK